MLCTAASDPIRCACTTAALGMMCSMRNTAFGLPCILVMALETVGFGLASMVNMVLVVVAVRVDLAVAHL